ncbi:hypothetical protein FRC14_006007 [Serendipita sp. 396]|nr:hypothetical protein FRC14_006007 [Serendipita sp. 396]KAG8779606.1 hypothetical protein FRC15_010048 [Serendipita sp. 397]KAG8796653.1 hypothetical protein FRC16_009600 [Serendipita sp. 398]KAG8819793.1 hypothetical protein FRC19_009521 [Serendipita sp. 401]KAG8829497.1 hypothetical protein FRC18_009262 [Serendipita sp. 400]KAG8853953.1 hypothetical protein FRB91_004187 [Serendipita sp. 411]KAG8865064.1 hypothetical protein FRC20_009927 [Serendipita sp. 405]KAG9052931.1 hypothetical prot
MTSVQYSGPLPAKKKSDLQEIAEKLSIDSSGTKDDLQTKIKAHLDSHDLSEDPTFSGLYPAKKKMMRKESSIMQKSVASEDDLAVLKRKVSGRRKQTPPPSAPEGESAGVLTAPPSPVRALIANVDAAISNAIPDAQALVQVAEKTGSKLQARLVTTFDRSREFLSNATNIASVTVLFEFLFILYVMVPWQYYELPVDKPGSSGAVSIPYPPISYLLSGHLYKQLVYWSLPTVVVPQIAGSLISFSTPRKDVDPLSAGIVKLALAIIMDESWFAVQGRTIGQWRVVGSAASLAFALAEATEERRVVMRQH